MKDKGPLNTSGWWSGPDITDVAGSEAHEEEVIRVSCAMFDRLFVKDLRGKFGHECPDSLLRMAAVSR